jgi:hypothetical protein
MLVHIYVATRKKKRYSTIMIFMQLVTLYSATSFEQS